jgi:RNA polymerase sigma factor (sigma-70 family)
MTMHYDPAPVGGDYAVEIRIRNGRVLQLMQRRGIPTAAALSRATGVAQTYIGEILNLKRIPLDRRGEWLTGVCKIAEALRCAPEDMFTQEQRTSFMESNKRVVMVSQAEVDHLLESAEKRIESPLALIEQQEISSALTEAIDMLSPRQQEAIRRHFGLDGPAETYEEIGDDWGVSRERVRQIEATALRKLKHPSRSTKLREAAYGPPTVKFDWDEFARVMDEHREEAWRKEQQEKLRNETREARVAAFYTPAPVTPPRQATPEDRPNNIQQFIADPGIDIVSLGNLQKGEQVFLFCPHLPVAYHGAAATILGFPTLIEDTPIVHIRFDGPLCTGELVIPKQYLRKAGE